jgi:hypothetical protein
MKARVVLAAVVMVAGAGPVAAQSAQERQVEAMVRTANAAYIEALMQHQRLLAERDPGLPPEDVRELIDTTGRVLWAAAAMANMCASARAIRMVLVGTRCSLVDADTAMLEQQRAELLSLLDKRP